jgi:hypothetical protein
VRTTASILGGAALIAIALLFTFRWEITSPHAGMVYRLDRWTGRVTPCVGLAAVCYEPEPVKEVNDWEPVAKPSDKRMPVEQPSK